MGDVADGETEAGDVVAVVRVPIDLAHELLRLACRGCGGRPRVVEPKWVENDFSALVQFGRLIEAARTAIMPPLGSGEAP